MDNKSLNINNIIINYLVVNCKKCAFPVDLEEEKALILIDGVGYTRLDLRVIYKIVRMRELNAIDDDELNHLISLYHEKLKTEEEINYLSTCRQDNEFKHGKKVEALYDEMEAKLSKNLEDINRELNDYQLLPEYVQIERLIDQAINIKNNKPLKMGLKNNGRK